LQMDGLSADGKRVEGACNAFYRQHGIAAFALAGCFHHQDILSRNCVADRLAARVRV
jgi:hypothetical protein